MISNIKLYLFIFIAFSMLNAEKLSTDYNYNFLSKAPEIKKNNHKITKKILSSNKLDFSIIADYNELLDKYGLTNEEFHFSNKVLNRSIEIYGIDSLETKVALLNLSLYYLKTDIQSAVAIRNFVKETMENKNYENSPALLYRIYLIHSIYEAMVNSDIDKAKMYANKALVTLKKVKFDNNNEYVNMFIFLGKLSVSNKEYEEAIKYGTNAVTINNKLTDSTNKTYNLIQIREVVSDAVEGLGSNKDSLNLYLLSIGDLEKNKLINTVYGAEVYTHYGYFLRKIGDYNHSITALKTALEIENKLKLPNDVNTIASFFYLGGMEDIRGNYKEAKKYYTEALFIYENVFKKSNKILRKHLKRIKINILQILNEMTKEKQSDDKIMP